MKAVVIYDLEPPGLGQLAHAMAKGFRRAGERAVARRAGSLQRDELVFADMIVLGVGKHLSPQMEATLARVEREAEHGTAIVAFDGRRRRVFRSTARATLRRLATNAPLLPRGLATFRLIPGGNASSADRSRVVGWALRLAPPLHARRSVTASEAAKPPAA